MCDYEIGVFVMNILEKRGGDDIDGSLTFHFLNTNIDNPAQSRILALQQFGNGKKYLSSLIFCEMFSLIEEINKIEKVDLIRFMVELKSRTSDRLIMSSTGKLHQNTDKLKGQYIEDVELYQQRADIFEL